MLIASIAIIGPALARIFNWPGLPGENSPAHFGTHLALRGTVLVYDLVARRQPHPATLIGYAAFVVCSEFGMAVTQMLE